MKSALGVAFLAIAASACVIGIAMLAAGLRHRDARLLRLGQRSVWVLLIAAIGAVGVMEWALVAHDFSLDYVANNNSRATPVLYSITGLWASLEGSILLWGLVLAGYLAVTAWRMRDRTSDPLVAWATIVGLAVATFFFVLMLGPANPFQPVDGPVPADGTGANPLLQNHPLMAVHPPMLYLGYVGFTIPFAFAIASLITGRLGEGWLAETRRTTLVAWGFLTAGIVLGGWWSYEVLGWGGFWAWDPVENASLLPWLTATAFIHSVIIQERRGMLRVWNLSLVIATFCLTILGTFITRSGVIDSVHAFTQSEIGPWFLSFLGASALAGIGLIAWRGDRLRAPGRIDSAVSRESAFLGNNLLFTSFAFVVLLGTVFPLLVEALQDRQMSVGRPYFDRMTVPIGLALLFLMAVAPALPWRATSGEVLRRRLVVPAWVGAVTMVLTVVFLGGGPGLVLAFGLGAFAASGIVRSVVVGARARRTATSERGPFAYWGMLRANPRLYGGLVVHLGVVVIAVSIAAFGSFATHSEVQLERGESADVGDYTVTFLGSGIDRTAQRTRVSADVQIERGDRDLGIYRPAISTFPNAPMGIGTPSVRNGLVEDVYLTLVSSPTEEGQATIGVSVNPLVIWLWIGGGIMATGTALALMPARRTEKVRRPTEPEPPDAARMATGEDSERAPVGGQT